MSFTRVINIRLADSSRPSSDPTLLLTFDKIDGEMAHLQHQVCWRTVTFPVQGHASLRATYKSPLCFIAPLVDNDVISVATLGNVGVGQQITYSREPSGELKFSDPVPGKEHAITCINGTLEKANLALGTANQSYNADPLLYFQDVSAGYSLPCQFTPRLVAYIDSGYQKNEIINGEIQSLAIWTKNLEELPDTTNWVLSYNPGTGNYTLELESN